MKETRNQQFLRTLEHVLFQLYGVSMAPVENKPVEETAGSRKVVVE
jgi:hypothetical protein